MRFAHRQQSARISGCASGASFRDSTLLRRNLVVLAAGDVRALVFRVVATRWCTLLLAACGVAPDQTPVPNPERVFRQSLPVVAEITDRSSVNFEKPWIIDVTDSLLYVLDHGDFALRAFALPSMEHEWTFDAASRGVYLRNPWQVVINAQGRGGVWVVEPILGEALLVDRTGLIRRHVPPINTRLARLVPLSTSILSTVISEGDTLWVEPKTQSPKDVARYGHFPDRALANLTPVYRQSMVGIDAEGGRWAAVFILTNGFAVYDHDALICYGTIPYGLAPDDITDRMREPRFWSGGVAISATNVYVLSRDHRSDTMSVIDVLDSATCTYQYSIPLASPAAAFAGRRDKLAIAYSDPVPRIEILDVSELNRERLQ
jgi:hypothetical protein